MAKAKRLDRFSFKEERRLLKFASERVCRCNIEAARGDERKKRSEDWKRSFDRQSPEKASLNTSLCPEGRVAATTTQHRLAWKQLRRNGLDPRRYIQLKIVVGRIVHYAR
jgi:hypothetical protein